MTLHKALKTGKPIRLKGHTFSYDIQGVYLTHINPDSWLDPEWFLFIAHLTVEDIISKEWEEKE